MTTSILDWTSFPLQSAGKPAAARFLVDVGAHPILLHGVVDGACTCAKASECRSAGKHPIDSSWQKSGVDAKSLVARLEKAPHFNIGLRTGVQPNGERILAIDDDGELAALETDLGKLPSTLQQRTGSGGTHRFYLVPADAKISNRVRVGGRAVDVRCDGGQVVFAPSETPAGRYVLTHRAKIAELPGAWLAAIAEHHAPAAAVPDISEWTLGGLKNQDARILAYCRRKAEEDRSIQGNDGSGALARWAGTVFWKLGLSEPEGMPLLAEMNRIGASPPWSDAELRHAMGNGMKPHPSRPGPRGHLLAEWAQRDSMSAPRRPHGGTGRATKASPRRTEGKEAKAVTQDMADDDDGEDGSKPDKPKLCLNGAPDGDHLELHELISDAARVLGERAPEVFCRDGKLVDAGPVEIYAARRRGERERASVTSVGVRQLPTSEVQRLLSRAARWTKWVWNKREKAFVEVHADPTPQLALQVSNMGRWESVRPLAGVLTAPSMRPDGSIIQSRGWDSETHYLYAPTRGYPVIPDLPTQDDAREALAQLREVFAPPGDGFDGFPFAGDAEQDVPVANVLTLIARPAIDGCVPAFVYDASTPGTGKGLIADAVCTIATGDDMPKGVFTDDQAELSKHLGSLVLAGVAVAGFDNIDQRIALCGGVLDAVLTARRPQLRILGKSDAPAVDWHAVVMVTGNNVQITGDTQRRCIKCRQEPEVERPELRSNFRVSDLLAHVREHRPELVRAALTVLRAYFVAGRPDVGVKPLGSFEAWSRLVASAIVFAGGHDVTQCVANKDGNSGDPSLEAVSNLLSAMHRIGKPMTAAELVAAGYDWDTDFRGIPIPGSESHPDIKEALETLVPRKGSNGRPSPKSVGMALKTYRSRVFGGLQLVAMSGRNGLIWQAKGPGAGLATLAGLSQPLRGRDHAGEGGLPS